MKLNGWRLQLAINLLVASSVSAQQIILDGRTTVKISYQSLKHEVPVTATIFHTFPAWEISEVADTVSPLNGEVWLSCPIRVVQQAYVLIHNVQLPLLMIPGDTIYVDFKGSPGSPIIEFDGKTKAIQEYYMARTARFPITVDQLMINLASSAPNLREFQMQADSLYSLDILFWNEYVETQAFPAWFIRFEENAIRYRNAYLRLYALTYQMLVEQKEDTIPTDFFAFFENDPSGQ